MTRGKARKGQPDNMVFALDIGTRSIIGMVGTVEEDRVKIVAIERAEHAERAMIDRSGEKGKKEAGGPGRFPSAPRQCGGGGTRPANQAGGIRDGAAQGSDYRR